jgi:PPP family 3-phenylpropionic acid transporter
MSEPERPAEPTAAATAHDPAERRAISIRLATYYTANFAKGGVQFPWWQVFLQGRGFSAPEIGWLMAIRFLVAMFSGPLVGRFADKSGERRRIMLVLSVGLFLTYWLYLLVDSFWAFAAIGILVAVLQAPIGPLGDSLTLMNARRIGVDYGRVRLWGSVSFIVTVYLAGEMLERAPTDAILWSIIVLSVLVIAGCWMLPDTRIEPKVLHWSATFRLLANPTFALFVLTCALLQTSHAIMYGFGNIFWIANGISKPLAGFFWVEGVVAEIILFWFGTALIKRYGAAGLMLMGAVAGVLRWVVTAMTVDVWVLGVVQLLHAFTFGAVYLGAMEFLKQAVPENLAATGQTLFNAIAMGLAFGIAMPLCGYAFQEMAGQSYYLMAGLSLLGGIGAIALIRRWDGRRLIILGS